MISVIMKVVSWLSLALLIVPSVLLLTGYGSLDLVKTMMLIATILWFLSAAASQKIDSRMKVFRRFLRRFAPHRIE